MVLSEINPTGKDKSYTISLICQISKTKQLNKRKTRNRPTNTANKLMFARGEGSGRRGKMGGEEWEIQTCSYEMNGSRE